jgi:hypothetical protein
MTAGYLDGVSPLTAQSRTVVLLRIALNFVSQPWVLIIGTAVVLLAVSLAVRRKPRLRQQTSVVMCPPAGLPAEVKLDANLHIESCSRRKEHQVSLHQGTPCYEK